MENRFVSKNHVWSGRSGVLLDRTAAGAAPNHSNQHAKSVEEGHFHSPKGDNSVLPKSKSTGLKSPFTAMDANPVLGVNLPAHMFMQAINFDSRQQRSDGQSDYQNDSEIDQELEDFPSSPKVEEPIHNGSLNVSEAQADLLEQQQAIEQAKLLQRFKELRAWQLQQQQLLMYQQQSQLMALKSEQSRVQDMITKQRQAQWGGKVVKAPSSDSSPFVSPRRRPAGIAQALAGGMAARYQHNHNMTEQGDSHRGQVHSISQGPIQPKTGLPRPQLPDTDSEGGCNTNPELYSNPGSIDSHDSADLHPLPKVPSEDGDINFLRQQAHMREWTTREAIPGSSDDGEDEYMRLLASQHQEEKHTNGWSSVSRQLQPASQRQIIPQSQAEVKDGNSPSAMDKSALYARREVSQPTDSRLKNDGFEVETDEGFGTQSFHSSPLSARQANSDPVTANVLSEDSRTEEGDDTLQKQSEEALLGDGDLDERPVSSAVTGKKSFEQLLEEQLRAEEEKIQESPPTVTSSKTPKRPFLRRGQGLERFKAPPKKRETTNARNAHQPRKPESFTTSAPARKTVNIGKTSAKGPKTAPKHQNRLESAKVENEQRTVPAPKTGQGLPGLAQKSLKLRPLAKNSTTDAKKSVDTTSTSAAVSSKTATGVGLSEGKKETDGADKSNPKSSVISQHGVKETKSQQETGNVKDVDVSFLAHLEKIGQTDKVEAEDLEEFEMLEHFADNASFSSNSSLVVKVLQRDRLKAAQFNGVPVAAYQQSFTRADHMRFFNPIKFGSQDEETEQKDGHISPPHVNVNSDSDTSSSDSSDTESEDSDLMSTIKHQDLRSVVPERKDCETGVQTDLNGFPEDRTSNNKNFWNADHTDESQSDTETKTSNKNSSPFFQQSDVTKSPVKRKIAGRTNINSSASNFVNGASPPDIDDPSSASYKLHLINQKKREGGLSKDSDSFSSSSDEETEMSHPRNSQSNDRNSNNLKVQSLTPSKGSLEENEDKDLYKDEFDDEEEWGETSVKQIRSDNSVGSDADDTLIEEKNSKEKADSDRAAEPFPTKASPPPTSKLITKLFPKLRPQKPPPKQQEQLDKLQQAREAPANDGVHSKLLREKLAQLEAEINKFRAENANLDRLRREREEGLSKLKREISDFEKEKNEELQRLNEFKTQEIKKLKHEKKVFEKYQKAARSMPDKREREEIETLRSQLAELQDELKRKESRWSANTTRLKSRVEELEQENVELKEEIRLLEKKRLEALQREQANKVSGRVVQQAQPVVVPCISGIGVNGAHVLHTDSEEEINPVREDKKKRKPTGLTLKPGNRGRPDKTSPRANHKADRSGSNNHRPKSGKQKSDKINSPSKSSNQKRGSDPLNLTRASLTEDVPRRQFNAEATPQQDSVSLSGSSSGIQPSQSRKLAARFNVDKSSIDKGGDYEEVQHPDGKLERIYNTGAREILFSNGTRKEISSDGQSIIVSFFNGDIKQIMADHRVVYYYSEAQTTHSTFPDGLEILQFPNNQVEKHYPDGTKEITFPDQTIKYLFPSGLEESVFTDGTVIRVEKTGDKTIEFPNGQREIHTQQYKKREYPDGTVKTVFPDGRQETRYANGRVRVKDRDGNVVMDNKT